ncbi:glycosyltransferase family 87 protein [Thermoflexus hugenholtzii]
MDFRGYYASARIAIRDGFQRIYDPHLQREVQQDILRSLPFRPNSEDYPIALTPYLPIFMVLFIPFSVFSPLPGFLIWSLLNLCIGVLYLRRRWVSGPGWDKLWIVMASYPALTNLFWGQPTVFMMIALGEFLIALRARRSGRAGLWLSMLLIKPQTLFLILPGLALARHWRTLGAFAGGALILLGSSVVLLGSDGIAGYMAQLREASLASAGHPSFHPEVQMNWRAFALVLQPWLPDQIRWGLAMIILVLSGVGALGLWKMRGSTEPFTWSLRLLGTLAATGAAAWHAHTHQAMILIPCLLDLLHYNLLNRRVLLAWAFAPWLAAGVGLLLAWIHPPLISPEAVLPGQTLLVFNIYFLIYATMKLKHFKILK